MPSNVVPLAGTSTPSGGRLRELVSGPTVAVTVLKPPRYPLGATPPSFAKGKESAKKLSSAARSRDALRSAWPESVTRVCDNGM